MAGAAHAPPSTGHWRQCEASHAHLILHQQPLITRATQQCTGANDLDSRPDLVPGTPLLVIDHRIMLDVESVPGPSLLSSFRVPQEQRPSRGMAHYCACAWTLCPCGNRTRPGFCKGPRAQIFNALLHKASTSYISQHSQP